MAVLGVEGSVHSIQVEGTGLDTLEADMPDVTCSVDDRIQGVGKNGGAVVSVFEYVEGYRCGVP